MHGERIGIDGGALGIYDGVVVWVEPDGTLTNRFRGEGGRRERMTDEYITRMKEQAADIWDDGYDAGHQTARAVNPEWPQEPPNPHR